MTDRLSRGERIRYAIPGDASDPAGIPAAVEAFLESMVSRNYAVRTINLRNVHLVEFAGWLAEQSITQPAQVTTPLLEQYQSWLHHYKKADGTPRTILGQYQRVHAVRYLFRFLAKSGRLQINVAANLELPRRQKPLPKAVLSQDEVELLIAQPDLSTVTGVRDRAILEILFATGIRRSELARLRIADVDVHTKTLTVRQGKGGKDRMIPISERAIGWMQRYISAVRWRFTCEPDDGVVFLTRFGHPVGLKYLSEMVAQHLARAGINKAGGCHLLRHATATFMLESGADIRFIQEMLGHANIETTQRYARVSITSLRGVYERTHPSAQSGSTAAVTGLSRLPTTQPNLF